MEHIIVMRAINRRNGGQQRKLSLALHSVLRDVSNPFSDPNFCGLYRLTPDMALGLIEELRAYFPRTSYANSIPVELKFLAALHFYAQGSYQKPDGREARISLSQASVSRAITQTTDALNMPQVLSKWIKFPYDINERQQVVQKNYRKFDIPGVLGYVDGTHILIKKPAVHEELYINRKGQHSLNVQVVCDSDLVILNINAKYPGSTHDAFIWRNSSVRDVMMNFSETFPCWVLGDSGYPLEPWILTPVLNAAENSPEARYTSLHIRARNCVERCFGVLKGRFRCLHKHRTLEYAPTKSGRIANACAVLHNLCLKGGLAEPNLEDSDEHTPLDDQTPSASRPPEGEVHRRGVQMRDNLINRLI